MSLCIGTGRAGELGVLVRDADALQRTSELNTLVFDKTGALTEDRPRIVSVHTAAGFSEPKALRLAAVLEQSSSYPLGQAILENAGTVYLQEVNAFRTLRGFGVSGEINGQSLLLGNRALMYEHHVSNTPLDEAIHSASTHGNTPVLLAVNGKLTALISLRDSLRRDSRDTLHRLRKQGYHLIMLTGDDPTTDQAIADEAGIDSVITGVLPERKA